MSEQEQVERARIKEADTAVWQGRSQAEWVTLAVSLLITLTVVGLLIYDLVVAGNAPAVITVDVQYADVREEGDRFYLPIQVANRGGQTAEDTTFEFLLQRADGANESTGLTFRFLAPGERAEASLIFNSDPRTGALTYTSNYLAP